MVRRAIGQCAPRSIWFCAVLGLRGAVVVAYLGWLTAYRFAPGAQERPPHLATVSFPASFSSDGFRLVLAIHPKCPYSRASVGELARILARFPDERASVVLVYRPLDQNDDWTDTDLARSAREQPRTQVVVDVCGQYARQLGMRTSGAVILYSPRSEAEFWGGITISRGHHGDNIGSDAIPAILSGRPPARPTAPMFGCAIYEEPGRLAASG